MEAFAAAEADVAASQHIKPAGEAWGGGKQRIGEIEQYMRKVLQYKELPNTWKKLSEIAPGILDGYMRMRESFVKPDPLGAVPKKIMELAFISADVVQAHPLGAILHTHLLIRAGAAVPEVVEAVALAIIECGVQNYKTSGLEIIEAAEKIAAELA